MGELAAKSSSQQARRATLAASAGTMIEAYDLLLYGYLASILAEQFFPTEHRTAALLNTFAIFAVGFAVRPLGGILFGHVGDRLGRRPALVISIILMAVATLAMGLLPTYASIGLWAPLLLLICRLLQGISVGGEYVGANILILEYAEHHRSGRSVSANLVGGYLGIAAAAATSLTLAETLSAEALTAWGWRLPFLAAVPLALVGVYLRLRIPDSPAFEAEAARSGAAGLPLATALRTAKRAMLVFSGWLVVVTLGGYLLFGYLPTYLIEVVGLDRSAAFGANLAAVTVLALGTIAGGHLVDRYPARLVAAGSAACVAVTVVPGFLIIQQGGLAAAIAGQAVWAVFVGVAATVSAVLSLTLFSVRSRYSATGISHNVTVTLFGGTAPYVSTWLIARTDNPLLPAWYLAAMALVSLATAATGLRHDRPVPMAAAASPG